MDWNCVFVTVGTTDFNDLIIILGLEGFVSYLVNHSCQKLIIQYGRGKELSENVMIHCQRYGIELETYRFKDSLDKDMEAADLIICHAGRSTSKITSLPLPQVQDPSLKLYQ
jgi:beta-1,4-N-acetylglucosaminyltransferase